MRYALILLFLWAMLAHADDGSVGVAGEGGRMRLLGGEHTSIRMVKEWVRLDIYPKYYTVSAQFQFENTDAATRVKMGFPEGGGGDGDGVGDYREYRNRSGYSHFTTTVDGKPVTATRTVKVAKDTRYDALWIKTVAFAKGQTRSVRVEYRAESGFSSAVGAGSSRFVNYNFTGGNWKGTLAQADLLLVSHIPGALFLFPAIPDKEKTTRISRKGNQLAITWKDWQAEANFVCSYLVSYPDWLVFDGKQPAIGYFDFAPMLEPTYTLVEPGIPPYLDWSPPVMQRDGVVYVKLKAFVRYLSMQAEAAEQPNQVALSWDGAAVLQAGTHTFRIAHGETIMQADGATMPLPARALLSVPAGDEAGNGNQLYVPLEPLVKALGGAMKVDAGKNKITLEIPPFWVKAGKRMQ